MAMFVSIAAPTGGMNIVKGLIANVKGELERRKVYRTTLNELKALTPRELTDLGISPGMIRQIALEAAYGK